MATKFTFKLNSKMTLETNIEEGKVSRRAHLRNSIYRN